MTAERYARVGAVSSALPTRVVPNAYFETLVDTSDEWIADRTGIRERRFAGEGESTATLAADAGAEALRRAGVSPAGIDLLIVATCTPERLIPSTAAFVQARLGMTGPAFDLNAACAGFAYALSVGAAQVKAGAADRVLVIGSEVLSRVLDLTDRTTCVLFGDGAGAVILEPSDDETGILDFLNEVDGSGACYLHMPAGGSAMPPSHETVEKRMHVVRQEGPHVFKYAVRKFAETSRHLLERNGLSPEQLDLFVAHQANLRIIDAARDRLGLPDAKVVKNIHEYGNTTAATIPLALGTALDEGRLRRGDLVLLASVGAGFTVGAVLLRWSGFEWKR